jgi:benzoate membrane transport protein
VSPTAAGRHRSPRPGPLRADLSTQAVVTGVTAALLGYASSIAVVVAGLAAAGASPDSVASALLALGIVMAVASTALSLSTRIPVSVVWSTPGLALLAGLGPVDGGWPAVLGAFCLTGALIVLTGLVRPLTRLLQSLPPALTSAVLAGVLLPFCLAPATALAPLPLEAGAICVAWLLALRFAPSYAAPIALAALLLSSWSPGAAGACPGRALCRGWTSTSRC